MTPPQSKCNGEGSNVKGRWCSTRCWSGCFKSCIWCFPSRKDEEPSSFDDCGEARAQEVDTHGEISLHDSQVRQFELDEQQLPRLNLEDHDCGEASAQEVDTHGEISAVDSQVRQFVSKEQQLPRLKLKDLKNLLNDVESKVETLKSRRSKSGASDLLEHCISQYTEHKEVLGTFIQSLPKDIKTKVIRGSKDVLMPLLSKTLQGMGNLQWVGLGLRLIAWALDNMHDTMQNYEDCLEILQDAVDHMKNTKKIWELTYGHEDTANLNLQKIIERVFRCVIICISNMNNVILRFVDAQRVKEVMTNLKQEIRDAKNDTSLFVDIEILGAIRKVDQQISFTDYNYNNIKVGGDEATSTAMEFLNKASNDMIALCLHGIGGVGKSFTGLEIYKKFESNKNWKQDSSFKCCRIGLALGIKDEKLVDIQKQILSKLCGCDASNISDCVEGKVKLIKELKKLSDPIFLYLDNVLESQHLEIILPKASYFPSGSKLLVTSRGTNIEGGLKRLGIDEIKLVGIKKMQDKEAQELLWKHINSEGRPIELKSGPLEKLEEKVIKLCGGLPLALRVVGGYIGSEEQKGPDDARVWQDVVDAMEKAEPLAGEEQDELYSRINVSIECLHADVKSAFLDIVSLYETGRAKWKPIKCLVGRHHLKTLQRRALLQKIRRPSEYSLIESQMRALMIGSPFESEFIEIHDVLLALARRMIKQDTHELRITGMDDFKMKLQHSGSLDKVVGLNGVRLEASMLQQMPLLRFLRNVEVEGESTEPVQIPHLSVVDGLNSMTAKLSFKFADCERLKYLDWRCEEETVFNLEILRHEKVSKTLEFLCLWNCRWLRNVGAIETLRCLKVLELGLCYKLSELPEGIGSLSNLKELSLFSCRSLQALPDGVSSLTNLKQLHLDHCNSLQKLPEAIGSLTNLKWLQLNDCHSLQKLPEAIGSLARLTCLSLMVCFKLKCLPNAISGLTSLTELILGWCKSLECLPDGVEGLKSLRKLHMQSCSSLKALPEQMACLTCLEELNLWDCQSLQMLPPGFSRLTGLTDLNVSNTSIKSLQEISSLTSLKTLHLYRCEAVHSLMEEGLFCMLGMVTDAAVSWSRCLPYLPQSLTSFSSLRRLSLEGCGINHPSLPEELTTLTGLQRLTLRSCESVESLSQGFTSLRDLESLEWEDCRSLQALVPQGVAQYWTRLTELSCRRCPCPSLQSLQELAGLAGLRSLTLADCGPGLDHSKLEVIWTLTGLTSLELINHEHLQALPNGIASLTSLESLDLSGCTSLLSLPEEISRITSLESLDLSGCKNLKCLPQGLSGATSLFSSGCTSLVEKDTNTYINPQNTLKTLSGLYSCLR